MKKSDKGNTFKLEEKRPLGKTEIQTNTFDSHLNNS